MSQNQHKQDVSNCKNYFQITHTHTHTHLKFGREQKNNIIDFFFFFFFFFFFCLRRLETLDCFSALKCLKVHSQLLLLQKHANLNILKTFQLKNENFQIKKKSYILYSSPQNIYCGYSLMSTHNLCFLAEITKIMFTPVNPSFTI